MLESALSCSGCGNPLRASDVVWVRGRDGALGAVYLAGAEDEVRAAMTAWHARCLSLDRPLPRRRSEPTADAGD